MSKTERANIITIAAGENLNGDLFETLTVDSTGRVVKATAVTDVIIGILYEDPDNKQAGDDSTGRGVPVALLNGSGRLQVKAGDTVAAGAVLVADTDAGRVTDIAAIANMTADSFAIGIAAEDGVDGQIIEFYPMPLSIGAT